MRNTLSTVTIARLLGVAVASISKWIDAGQLKAGKTPGGHRRVTKEDLVAFLRRQGLPVPEELNAPPLRILVVDDEVAVANMIADEISIRHDEFEVLQANDGYTAGQMVALAKPDIVILDLRIPGIDGFEVCRGIKSSDKTRQTAVIAITAHSSEDVRQRILEAGASAYFTKPLDMDALMEEVEAALAVQV